MGLLDQLWDDTVAGPRPDIGLGKLRKDNFRSNSGKKSEAVNSERSFGEEAVRVTRSIMIVKPPQQDSPPVSPGGAATTPVSPFAGGEGREAFRFRRRSASFAYEKASGIGQLRSPRPPYNV